MDRMSYQDMTLLSGNVGDFPSWGILQTNELIREIYAREVYEYRRCTRCNKPFSKHDIYKNIVDPLILDSMTVGELESRYGNTPGNCSCCYGELEYIFPPVAQDWEGISDDSFLSVLVNTHGKVLGMLLTVDISTDDLYNMELSTHYKPTVTANIQNAIRAQTGKIPTRVRHYAAIGMIKTATNVDRILQLFYSWARYQEKNGTEIPAFAEMNEASKFTGFCQKAIGIKKIEGIEQDKDNGNIPDQYKSICVYSYEMVDTLLRLERAGFNGSIR